MHKYDPSCSLSILQLQRFTFYKQINMRSQEIIEKILHTDRAYYHAVIKQTPNQQYTYILNGSGCRSQANLLSYPLYRACLYLSILSEEAQEPYVLMITASHNPAQYNGFKIGTAGEQIVSKKILKMIQDGINNTEIFDKFIRDNTENFFIKQKEIKIFIGRDCRDSSLGLSQIAISVFQLFKITVIDIGQCSTPQVFSFSNYIFSNFISQINGKNAKDYHRKYIQVALNSFRTLYQKILQTKLQDFKQQNKPKILLDFANGSGAISFQPYMEIFQACFNLTVINNKQFSKPNFKCGAEYVHKNWNNLNPEKQYNQFDFCFFFDGDSDRVLAKIKGSNEICDGNQLLVFYIKTLMKIRSNIPKQIEYKINEKNGKLEIKAVGNINSNQGAIQAIQKLNVPIMRSDVGVQNLYEAALKDGVVSAFFQPNGHGGILISQSFYRVVQKLLQEYPDNFELEFFIKIYRILRNNARGYALHNVLIFFLFQAYLNGPGKYQSKFYHPYQSSSKEIHIPFDFFDLFENGDEKLYLQKPQDLSYSLQQIVEKNPSTNIVVRKSGTEKGLIRIQIQAKNFVLCNQISQQIVQLISNYISMGNSNKI